MQGEKEEKLKRGTCPGHSPRETKSSGKKPVKTKVLPNPGQPRRRKPPPQPSPVVGQGGAPFGKLKPSNFLPLSFLLGSMFPYKKPKVAIVIALIKKKNSVVAPHCLQNTTELISLAFLTCCPLDQSISPTHSSLIFSSSVLETQDKLFNVP